VSLKHCRMWLEAPVADGGRVAPDGAVANPFPPDPRRRVMRLLVLAHDAWGPATSKTGHVLVKSSRDGWSKDEVVAIVDRSKAGRDAGEFASVAKGIPVVGSVREGLDLKPDALAIGIAPVGGRLPDFWRPDLEAAIGAGLTILNGLHLFLGDDPSLAALAAKHGAKLVDVRRPPPEKRIATGEGALVDALVVLHVGTDCSSGKMTAAVALAQEARRRGLDAGFVATGQTGIMIGADAGVAIDAVVSDFVAGTVEKLVLDVAAQGRTIIFVEGQGSITHPAYAGVTSSLLMGAFPDILVVSDEPRRACYTFPSAFPFPKNDAAKEIALNEALLTATTAGRAACLALVTRGLDDAAYADEVRRAERATGLPAGDVFRGDAPKLLDAILRAAEARGVWKDGRPVHGAKRRRMGIA